MLLAIDIGNTHISLGVFKNGRLIKRYTIQTKEKNYAPGLKKILSQNKISAAILCSVVPKAEKILTEDLKKLTGRKPYNIGKDIKVPIKNLYRRPRQVGQDRLVNAYAGIKLYGAPLVVVDFGTAITFDVISKDKEYLGGIILPGLEISLEGLYRRTALLPKIKLAKPKEFIGRDTKDSILSGIIYGFSAATDGLIRELKKKIGANALSIGTGGNINLMRKFCKRLDKIDEALTLKGLDALYEK